jgi:hypothetical protein
MLSRRVSRYHGGWSGDGGVSGGDGNDIIV